MFIYIILPTTRNEQMPPKIQVFLLIESQAQRKYSQELPEGYNNWYFQHPNSGRKEDIELITEGRTENFCYLLGFRKHDISKQEVLLSVDALC